MKSWNIAVLFALATSSAFACGGTSMEGDSETHWVACKRTEDCSGAQICEAKRCVEPAPDGAGGRNSNLPSGGTGSGRTTGTGGGPTTGTGGGPTTGTGGGPTTGTGGGPMGGSGAPGSGGSQGEEPDWSCLGQPTIPDDAAGISVDFMLNDTLGSPIANAQTRLCPRLDIDCTEPVTEAVDGRVTLTVPGGFDGYAWFTTPTTWPTYLAVHGSSFRFSSQVAVQFARPETITALGDLLESPQLAGNAVALVTVRDCAGRPARDVTFLALESSATRRPFYSINGIPDKDAAVTDASGTGGWVNVPPGSLTLEAVLTDGTARVAGRHALFVRPDSMMLVNVAANDDE